MNKLLARQLKKFEFSEEQLPQDLKSWKRFLQSIENTYSQHEKDRYLIERSFEISSKEINDQIQQNKEMSAHLAQSSKLAAIGTLASGVAHELNNPLAAVRGYVELLLRSCGKENPDARNTLTRVVGLTERMAKITGQLLKLSHKSTEDDIGFCNLKDSLSDIVDISSKQFELNKIQIKANYESKDLVVCGDLTRMAGVFQNLLTNSRDAFASNPSATRRSMVEISVKDSDDPNYLDITYKDNAGGIPEHILPRIFDPFFTTKGVGGGTGLGLSLIRNSLVEIDSSISVVVEAPCTIFTIKLKKSNEIVQNNKGTHTLAPAKMETTAIRPRTLYISSNSTSTFADEFKSYLNVTNVTCNKEKMTNITERDFNYVILDGVQNFGFVYSAVKDILLSKPEAKLVILGATAAECESASGLSEFSYLHIENPIRSRADFLFKLNDFNPTFAAAA